MEQMLLNWLVTVVMLFVGITLNSMNARISAIEKILMGGKK